MSYKVPHRNSTFCGTVWTFLWSASRLEISGTVPGLAWLVQLSQPPSTCSWDISVVGQSSRNFWKVPGLAWLVQLWQPPSTCSWDISGVSQWSRNFWNGPSHSFVWSAQCIMTFIKCYFGDCHSYRALICIRLWNLSKYFIFGGINSP